MIQVGVIIASDKGAAGLREDLCAPLIVDMVSSKGYEVTSIKILPDDREALSNEIIRLCDTENIGLILTSGGTGFSLRDVTPEATRAVIEREAPGIAEAIRYNSLQITPKAMLSRAIAGIRGKTLIVNLPGSPKAVKESLEYIIEPLKHGLEVLTGVATECADPINKK